jgi:WD40 repeat protein
MSDLGVWLAEPSQSDTREYLLKHQPRDFIEIERDFNRYYRWLTDFGFIEAKLKLLGVQPLIEDYDLGRNADVWLSEGQTETLKLIQRAIRKSAHVLEKDKTQLAGQLLGRLLDFEKPQIQGLLEVARQLKNSPWLRPLRANLERPGEGCLRTLTGHTSGVNAVAIAPDGKRAISASFDNTLKIWDTEAGTEVRTLTGHTNSVFAVDLAPDGLTAISASRDNTLKIWDTETGTEVRTLIGHTDWVNAVDLAPDGLTAISASSDETLKIWDIETGTEVRTLTGHTTWVYAVDLAPNGKTAISASRDNTLKIWDLLSGKEVASFSGDAEFKCCTIAPDGVTVVAGDASGRVHFLRLEGMGDLGDV